MNLPDASTNHDGLLTSQDIGQVTRNKSSKPGTTSHGGGDATLDVGARTLARFGALVEIALIRIGADDGAHGTDIETEQSTADNGHRRNDIDLDLVVNILPKTQWNPGRDSRCRSPS